MILMITTITDHNKNAKSSILKQVTIVTIVTVDDSNATGTCILYSEWSDAVYA